MSTSEPTAAHAAEVACHGCKATFAGTIDAVRLAGWTWYSDAAARYWWCPACSADKPDRLLKHRAKCRAEAVEANADPRREEKLKAREAAGG